MEKNDNQFYAIPPGGTFRFACGPQVGCFNECCRDLNQVLTPFDVMRLKGHLEMTSTEFLRVYARRHDGPETGLPVVTLRPQPGPEKKCPFVSPEGCRVYPVRPASCRMYPVARMACRDRHSGRIREEFMLICESHCRGFDAGPSLTVGEWTADQGLEAYNAANDLLIELIGIKRRHRPGDLPRELADQLFTALYDLDDFRARIENGLCDDLGVPLRDRRLAAGDDDEALLKTALDYAAGCLRSGPA